MFEQNFIIGNTPMIKINYKYKEKNKQIFAKLEYYNFTGSIKDRVAFYMINNAKAKGTLKEKQPLIEATSGNTGIGLAALAAAKGYRILGLTIIILYIFLCLIGLVKKEYN